MAADPASDVGRDSSVQGAVQVLFGGGRPTQVVGQGDLGDRVDPDVAGTGGRFAGTVIAADLNRDGCSDVVVTDSFTGTVWALWGSAAGISADRSTRLLSLSEAGVQLGLGLAFIPEPSPVLAVGTEEGANGGVRLYPVRADGSLGTYRLIAQESQGVGTVYPHGVSTWGFGAALSASDDILVIAAAQADDEGGGDPGSVYVLRMRSDLGYSITRITQDSPGVPGHYRRGGSFGSAASVFDDYLAITSTGRILAFRLDQATDSVHAHFLTSLTPEHGVYGDVVEVYRPCPGSYGVLTVAGPRTSGPDAVVSAPFTSTGSCRPTRLGALPTDWSGWTPISINRDARNDTDAETETAALLDENQQLRLVTHGAATTTMPTREPAPLLLAPPSA